MTVSVIIPALNEEKLIGECLESIINGSEHPIEVIVADGGSVDQTVVIAKLLGAKVVDNQLIHAAGGRNAAVKAAGGDILAFTDADCQADLDWVKNIRIAFEQEPINGLGGYIEPASPENEYESFWGEIWLKNVFWFGDTPRFVVDRELRQSFITANCAYTSELFKRLGGFSEWFANNAEDIDFMWRALNSGAMLKYDPSVRIKAHSPANMNGINKKSFRDGYSSSKLQKVYGKFINFDPNIYKMFLKQIFPALKGDKRSKMLLSELSYHLMGKYYGSLKARVINL